MIFIFKFASEKHIILFIMKQKNNNKVHLNGYIKSMNVNEVEGKTFANILVGTSEIIPDKDPRYTSHMVKVNTESESELANELREMAKASEDQKNFISLDGKLATSEKDGRRFFYVAADSSSVKFNEGIAKGESRNTITIEGNVSRIDIISDKGFAVLGVAMNYWVPGKSVDRNGKEIPYTEKVNFLDVRINGKRLPDVYKQLVENKIEVGDKIEVRGQMHNDDYTKDEQKIYTIKIDANKVELKLKKGQKAAATTEKEPSTAEKEQKAAATAEQKPATAEKEPKKKVEKKAKAEPKKKTKKGVSMS